ncbi:MAG: transketolase [Acidimicrobiales bacterium]|jgi:transketolase|nr:transketolase [Acidimicrobiales bacterium]
MTNMTDAELEQQAVAVIKGLAMDGPHAARSGHQGTAMALAPLAHVLWTRIMTYDASEPLWADRDRFILSAGHASMLLYSMLHLTGHGLSLDDLRNFRQWGSATPGHPEVGHTAGVEVTTGPLGQGLANAVGMAMAERNLRARFGPELCDHHTFVVCGDGDLAEGISHEAASLAGHLGLGRLVAVYDDNHITIDGPTELALSDDAVARFEAYGWHVIDIGEAAEDLDAIEAAIRHAMGEADRPSLVVIRSHIGSSSPDVDTSAVHGYSLRDDGIAETRELLGLPADESFWISPDVASFYTLAGSRGAGEREAWTARLESAHIDLDEWNACQAGSGLDGWETSLPTWKAGSAVATRKAGNACLEALLDVVPGLIGGGADLTGNTGTTISGHGVQGADCPEGRQIFFGVREHAMGAICNGLALHGGALPVCGTFLVFSDYMRGAVRLAALSGARTVFVWTHDSVGVGEDGPTHQPVEHAASLRAIPDLTVFRPADANETAAAWHYTVNGSGPVAMLLTRQDVPVLVGTDDPESVARGGYVLADPDTPPDVVIIGTGSEVSVALDAAATLTAGGLAVRVVSMPSVDLFAAQTDSYHDEVLPPSVPVVSVEAGVTFGWSRWADRSVGIDRFGASAPGDEVMARLGITPEAVAEAARDLLSA